MPTLLPTVKAADLWCSSAFSPTLAIQAFQEEPAAKPAIHFVRDFTTGELLFLHGPVEQVLGIGREGFAAEALTEGTPAGRSLAGELREHGTARAVRLVAGTTGIPRQVEVRLRLTETGGRRLVTGWAGQVPAAGRGQANDAILKQFLEAVPDMVAISGPDGSFEFVNRRFADFWEVTVSAMTGRHPATLPRRHPELREALAAALPATLGADRPHEQELRLNGPDETRVLRLIQVALDGAEPGQRRVYHIVSDVTAERLAQEKMTETAERRRQYVEMQQEFVSMVSHEFRTPIAVIQGAHYLFGQRKGTLPPEHREWFDKILELQTSGLSRLKELVDQVLMLNRLERMTNEPELTLEAVDELVRKVVDIFNTSLGEKRVLTDCQVPAGWQRSIDVRMITAALENLISNGLKYSTDQVTVSLREESGGWQVAVADRGRGIPPEEQKNLFQPFFRASNVGRTPGTGLGLSIVQRAVEFHGGVVSCESRMDHGTTFRLTFPPPASPSPAP